MRRFFGVHYVGVLPRITPSVFPALIYAWIYARIESILLLFPRSFPIREVEHKGARKEGSGVSHFNGRRLIIYFAIDVYHCAYIHSCSHLEAYIGALHTAATLSYNDIKSEKSCALFRGRKYAKINRSFCIRSHTRVVTSRYPRKKIFENVWTTYEKSVRENVISSFFSLSSFSSKFFKSNAHFIFYGTSTNFAEAVCRARFFFSVGVIRGAASVSSSSVKRDARCSEASCTLAALRGNDHRGMTTVSFRSL